MEPVGEGDVEKIGVGWVRETGVGTYFRRSPPPPTEMCPVRRHTRSPLFSGDGRVHRSQVGKNFRLLS